MKHTPLTLFVTTVFVVALHADPVDWTAYKKSFDIEFPGYSGQETLTDFPVLVRLSAALNEFDYSKCAADGGDVRFSDADGNLLSSEIDTWNPGGESLVWVKVPSFNRDTTITAHYSCYAPAIVNPKDVWSNGYLGVWHLNETARTFADSTQTGVNFTLDSKYNDCVGRGVSGSIGNAVEFDLVTEGDNAHNGRIVAKDGTNNRYCNTTTLTVEAWLYQRGTRGSYVIYHKNKGRAFGWQLATSGTQMVTAWGTTNDTEEVAITDVKVARSTVSGEWCHQAAVFDNDSAGVATTYRNGNKGTPVAIPEGYKIVADKGDLYVGNSGSTQAYPGRVDEVRISSVARSEDWVSATYGTVADADFTSYVMPNDWKKYSHTFSVKFDGYTGTETLTDFPVLVKISETSIPGFHYSDCRKENGGDLCFVDENGNLLDCEIDIWDTSGTSLIWVKVPTLSATTILKVYYGWLFAPAVNPKAVWSNGYAGVWHMNETARPMLDSTTNAINFTRTYAYSPASKFDESVRFAESGVVGRAVAFTPVAVDAGKSNQGGLLAPDSAGKLCGLDAMTIEIWAKTDAFETSSQYMIGRRMASTVNGRKVRAYEFEYTGKAPKATFYLENGQDNDNAKCALTPSAMSADLAGLWNYHCASYNRFATSHTNYLNGAVAATAVNDTGYPIHAVPDDLCLGNDCNPAQQKVFDGSLDELRISNVARSADWVKATYDTIKDHDTFTTYTAAHENRRGMLILFW